ncbi:hypothetical protein G9C85_04665 [Halorubellus sp. JP-L1]|uniref:hypothetical protein n=1 Tax=Halorubellus sp. JP-L1 TaxID=2715753 RepID=UPI00140A1B3A|nr:hypothetical protein [Halorubellus sp. JP-L1]NHN40928.1 hypothetical protein [Halorubellus sp. JP-L1]
MRIEVRTLGWLEQTHGDFRRFWTAECGSFDFLNSIVPYLGRYDPEARYYISVTVSDAGFDVSETVGDHYSTAVLNAAVEGPELALSDPDTAQSVGYVGLDFLHRSWAEHVRGDGLLPESDLQACIVLEYDEALTLSETEITRAEIAEKRAATEEPSHSGSAGRADESSGGDRRSGVRRVPGTAFEVDYEGRISNEEAGMLELPAGISSAFPHDDGLVALVGESDIENRRVEGNVLRLTRDCEVDWWMDSLPDESGRVTSIWFLDGRLLVRTSSGPVIEVDTANGAVLATDV